ncbi:MAG: MarR family transcriptional regulator [Alphaproteobacteria bacterium]|nr:MarR family transcriptional regulator [Alphaproteobacteria bacterium]MBU1516649.1 MarR family transcriptional regulator [Alphaproteobacteria bacterium]MBU2094405.1 MarR family transcriptional regulator [Alphaproteobacteria bacterium]MBU2153290.1 MarR family transcriptional regulator [Alphaproteobacteria bacterium]MBU2307576.1 MarR family transcriptional regulator [Alphaproteobacteria bacterium]
MAFSETGSRDLGLTPQQHQALLAIRAHPDSAPMTVSELARVLLVKNHSALGLVDRLVERELLKRAPSPLDRRRVELTLTDLGRRKLETISRNNLGQLQSSLPVFTDLMHALEQLELPTPDLKALEGDPQDTSSAPARRARRKTP